MHPFGFGRGVHMYRVGVSRLHIAVYMRVLAQFLGVPLVSLWSVVEGPPPLFGSSLL